MSSSLPFLPALFNKMDFYLMARIAPVYETPAWFSLLTEREILWPVDALIAENKFLRGNADMRTLYMSFASLLFFARADNGDLFGWAVDADGRIRRPDVFRWNHENDSRAWFAGDFESYLKKLRAPKKPKPSRSKS